MSANFSWGTPISGLIDREVRELFDASRHWPCTSQRGAQWRL